jgi:integrative and conjugative element protein (TIGR02256 family)
MSGLLFARHDGGTIYFTEPVVRCMHAHRQFSSTSREAGGVLLGRHLLDCQDAIVDEVTEPARTDRRSWAGFFRSLAHHAIAVKRWHASGGTCAYLGSWHTHPEPDPHPSSVDLADWRHALARDHYDGAALFFVIVGTQRLRTWQGDRRAAAIQEIHPKREA